ncbi:LytR/AlgR family response regulator transcription factor [Nubsella zeaxanthinifaciens]|uniref:LytR/AlgR family response regulator transcription factor n=1 Tax=Nubsella zeaxanthinifaciens TaxID=392412 RepID=UPI003D06726E
METTTREKSLSDSFYVKEKKKLVKINVNDIIAFESRLHQVVIHTNTSNIILVTTLERLKNMLTDRKEFIQVHRSFIISEKYIRTINSGVIELFNETKITIGRIYKKQFEDMIKERILQ